MRIHNIPGVPTPSPWPGTWEGTMECIILDFKNPTNFTFTTKTKYWELCDFEYELGAHVNRMGHMQRPGYQIGNHYALEIGSVAHRVELMGYEDSEATLRFIDRGTTLMHPVFDLSALPHAFLVAPPFSSRGYLSGIKPFLGERWEETVCLYYQRALEEKRVKIKIVSEHPTKEAHEVRLFTLPHNDNLGDRLVLEEFAREGTYECCLNDDIGMISPEEMQDLIEEEKAAGNWYAYRRERVLGDPPN